MALPKIIYQTIENYTTKKKKKSVARGFCHLLSPLFQFSKILSFSPQNEPLPTSSSFSLPDSPEPSHFVYSMGKTVSHSSCAWPYFPVAQFPRSPLTRAVTMWLALVCAVPANPNRLPPVFFSRSSKTQASTLQNQDILKQFHCRL